MRDFDIIGDLGRTLDPSGPPPHRLRARVLDELMTPRTETTVRKPRRRWVFGLAAAAAALAATAAAVVVSAGNVDVEREPARGPLAFTNAATLLTGAADRARGLAAPIVRPDQFVYTETVATARSRNEATGEEKVETLRRQAWQSVDGTRDGSARTAPRDGTGQTREDRLAGCRDGRETHTKGGKTVEVACVPSPAYRTDLPTDTDAMLRYLKEKGAGTRNPGNQQAFTVGADLIGDAYLSPAARAALLEALARIPSVTIVGDVTDEAGRPGVAVTITEAQDSRAEIIFDKVTGDVLGKRTTALDGRVLYSAAVLTVAIVDAVGATA
jgi:hypothetical protein